MARILIYSSSSANSLKTEQLLVNKLEYAGFDVTKEISSDVNLIVCIGGDGTFLEAVHHFGFPRIPFIGINTGHLGFFQEIMPDQLDQFIYDYRRGAYSLQRMQTVKAVVEHDGKSDEFIGLNEIVLRSSATYSVHLNISIGGGFIERFSGDGLLISTPAGSTAYNYSLGGSIVDPRIRLLQVTPIAPMNTTAYRSFTSSILLPPDLSLKIVPDNNGIKDEIMVTYDGFAVEFDNIESLTASLAEESVELLRLESYDFWTKVKSKFL